MKINFDLKNIKKLAFSSVLLATMTCGMTTGCGKKQATYEIDDLVVAKNTTRSDYEFDRYMILEKKDNGKLKDINTGFEYKQEQFKDLDYSDKWTNKEPSMKYFSLVCDTEEKELTTEEINRLFNNYRNSLEFYDQQKAISFAEAKKALIVNPDKDEESALSYIDLDKLLESSNLLAEEADNKYYPTYKSEDDMGIIYGVDNHPFGRRLSQENIENQKKEVEYSGQLNGWLYFEASKQLKRQYDEELTKKIAEALNISSNNITISLDEFNQAVCQYNNMSIPLPDEISTSYKFFNNQEEKVEQVKNGQTKDKVTLKGYILDKEEGALERAYPVYQVPYNPTLNENLRNANNTLAKLKQSSITLRSDIGSYYFETTPNENTKSKAK